MADDATSMTLLERLRSGERDAWSRSMDLYRPLVLYWCRRGGAGEEAEDLAQEVFAAVAAGIEEFRRDRPGDTFRGWLRVITRRRLADSRRRHDRRVDEAAGGTAAGAVLGEQPEPPEGDAEERREVEEVYLRALDLVRPEFEAKTWRAFWRVAVGGEDTAAVARDSGVTTAAVRLAKSRILRRLKEVVGDLVDHGPA